MKINWHYIAHGLIGTTITVCQAIAMGNPDPKVVSVCHIVSLVAIQLGMSWGVWQGSQIKMLNDAAQELAPATEERRA
jgi:hypothetical protein